MRKAKKKFEKNLAKDARKNPKAFYSYLKSETANRQSVGPLKVNDAIVTDDEKQAEILNQFFTSVFTQEDLDNLRFPDPVYMGSSPLDSVPFHQNWSRKRLTSCGLRPLLVLTRSVPESYRGWWMLSVYRWP